MDYSKKQQAMLKGGAIVAKVVKELESLIVPGITTLELDAKADELIHKYGGVPGFKKVPGYSWATCLSVNEIVVHGIPNSYQLAKNDLLKLDIGVFCDGYHTDYGNTYCVGNKPTKEIRQFLAAGRETLNRAIKLVKAGEHIGRVSDLIEKSIHKAGYEIIYNLTGHCVGKELHEDPLIPQFLEKPLHKTPKFKAGTAYAVEIIYSFKDSEIRDAGTDGWSLRTLNRSQSAFWENTLFVTETETHIIIN